MPSSACFYLWLLSLHPVVCIAFALCEHTETLSWRSEICWYLNTPSGKTPQEQIVSGSPTERRTAPRVLRPVPLHPASVLLGLSAPHHSILPSIPLESYHQVCLLQEALRLPFGVCRVAGESGERRGREPC